MSLSLRCDKLKDQRVVVFGFSNYCIWIPKFYFDREYLPKLLLG